ncbi:D-sedoheptulose-7-phosphate isomerase [Dinghuibacter silviterrae]|uniref:Phosphoheptose isomerase n=1 Tax=Dinghuibacter silviterrae TaxID=1539049 RepID=A0A4R8DSD0_9BACT|nr:SIS domain-containing protein [Dinghuibacter silviterrae]TDX00071.1 phosphoheptose isomerase [Dinghuibacter silviterrae]
MIDLIDDVVNASIQVKQSILANQDIKADIASAANALIRLFEGSGKFLVAGNGGSAADAQHIAAEFVVRFKRNRRALPAIALTVDSSVLTAAGNDFSFDEVFSRQVEALGSSGDVFLGISTSGNSRNILAALRAAKAAGLETIALTGKHITPMDALADIVIKAPSEVTARIQEAHIMIGHILCQIVDDHFAGELA